MIAGCIWHTDQGDLQTLKRILDHEVLGEHTMPIESETEDVAKLSHMASEFAEGFNTGDVERIMRFYGDSYVDINFRNPVPIMAGALGILCSSDPERRFSRAGAT